MKLRNLERMQRTGSRVRLQVVPGMFRGACPGPIAWPGNLFLLGLIALFVVQAPGIKAAQSETALGSALPTPSHSPAADAPAPGQSTNTVLGIQDARFVLNGRPAFLLGISYYAALGASAQNIQNDLDDLQRDGFNWLRVWATWTAFGQDISAVDSQGRPHQPFLGKLQWLVTECDRRGFVVDVTLTRSAPSSGQGGGGGLSDFASHARAVETLLTALRRQRNWYLDLANEHDVGDARYVSPGELKALRALARRLDPQVLVTASFGGHDLTRGDISNAVVTAGLDFLAPHRPREPESPAQTEARTRNCLALAQTVQRAVPVLYQEPFRRGYGGWQPLANDFFKDLRGALTGGAAGWCFHNGSEQSSPDHQPRRSFDLRTKRLWDQLDLEERKVVSGAKAVLTGRAEPAGPSLGYPSGAEN